MFNNRGVKRARAIPSEYDPVYPYEREPFVISAPFVNTDRGLTTDPPGFIAIKAQPPLTFDNQGKLTLVGGSDLNVQVDSSKGLTKDNNKIQAKVAEPVTFDNTGNIALNVNTAQGLKITDGKLAVGVDGTSINFRHDGVLTVPLPSFDDSRYARLTWANTFTQTQTIHGAGNGFLQVKSTNLSLLGKGIVMGYGSDEAYIVSEATRKPLRFGASGNGRLDLDLENESKILNVPAPAASSDVANKAYVDRKVSEVTIDDSNYAKLNAEQTFTQTQTIRGANNKAILKVLSDTNSILGAGIILGWGSDSAFVVGDDPAKVKPLKFFKGNAGGKLNLDLQNQTRIMNVPTPTSGTDVANKNYVDNKLSGAGGPILTLTEAGAQDPFVAFNNLNNTRMGYVGFQNPGNNQVAPNNHNIELWAVNDIRLTAGANNVVYCNRPYKYQGNKLCHAGRGIVCVADQNNANSVYLTSLSGAARLKFSNPEGDSDDRILWLDFENKTSIVNAPRPTRAGDLVPLGYMTSALAAERARTRTETARTMGGYTLWTGDTPFANARAVGDQPFDQSLALSLTATAGGLVCGTLFVQGTAQYATLPLTQDSLVFELLFDEFGALASTCSLDPTHWGPRVKGARPNHLAFMPDKGTYPTSTNLIENTIIQKVYVHEDAEPLTLVVRLNAKRPYSVTFTLKGLTNPSLKDLPLHTSTANFAYLGAAPSPIPDDDHDQ